MSKIDSLEGLTPSFTKAPRELAEKVFDGLAPVYSSICFSRDVAERVQSHLPAPFKLGDVVSLKSGGPPLTIVDIGHSGLIWCQWPGDAPREIWSAGYPPECLVKPLA